MGGGKNPAPPRRKDFTSQASPYQPLGNYAASGKCPEIVKISPRFKRSPGVHVIVKISPRFKRSPGVHEIMKISQPFRQIWVLIITMSHSASSTSTGPVQVLPAFWFLTLTHVWSLMTHSHTTTAAAAHSAPWPLLQEAKKEEEAPSAGGADIGGDLPAVRHAGLFADGQGGSEALGPSAVGAIARSAPGLRPENFRDAPCHITDRLLDQFGGPVFQPQADLTYQTQSMFDGKSQHGQVFNLSLWQLGWGKGCSSKPPRLPARSLHGSSLTSL